MYMLKLNSAIPVKISNAVQSRTFSDAWCLACVQLDRCFVWTNRNKYKIGGFLGAVVGCRSVVHVFRTTKTIL